MVVMCKVIATVAVTIAALTATETATVTDYHNRDLDRNRDIVTVTRIDANKDVTVAVTATVMAAATANI